MESSSQDRNLPASQRKLQQARDDGQVSRSKDLGHLAVLGSGISALLVLVPHFLGRIQQAFANQLVFNAGSLQKPLETFNRLQEMAGTGLEACVSFAAVVMTASVVSTLMSGGWVFTLKPIMPNFNHINPLAGFGRIFSKEQATELLKVLVITTAIVSVSVSYVLRHIDQVTGLALQPSAAALLQLGDILSTLLLLMVMVIGVVAMIDVPLQAFLYALRMRMSFQEIKQEHKESEGDPHVKGKRRARQRELANRNSVSATPTADFVVMNPTHYAVALKYDEASMDAPQVVAKGADLLAMRIRDLATQHAVPVLQSPRLARALYAHAEINQEIPSALFTAVAQVLAYVFRLKAALRGEAPMPGELPEPSVPLELDPHYPSHTATPV